MTHLKLYDFWIRRLYLPLALIFIVSGGLGLYSIYGENYLNQVNTLNSLAETVAKLSRDSLLSNDEVELFRSLSRIGSSGEFAILVENQNKSLAVKYPIYRSVESFASNRNGYIISNAAINGYQGEEVGRVLIEAPRNEITNAQRFVFLLLGILTLFAFITYNLRVLMGDFRKLDALINGGILENNEGHLKFFELHSIFLKVKGLTRSLIAHEKEESKRRENERVVEIAKQVSHDIRSPLSALTLVASRLEGLPEDQRVLLRNASQRITDIANQLLLKSRVETSVEAGKSTSQSNLQSSNFNEPTMLASLLDDILSEKRSQYRELTNVDITLDIKEAYGLFVDFNPVELRRIISNLINNSVEALDSSQHGKVTVAVRNQGGKSLILILDNGKGIPESILEKVGTKGFSNGKSGSTSGSGLGLYHAKNAVEIKGGSFQITSRENEGTLITIGLEKVPPPPWFLASLRLSEEQVIVVLDDDQSIHDVWGSRFNNLFRSRGHSRLQHFRSGKALGTWLESGGVSSARIFLIDYELIGHQETGLDWIVKFGIQNNSILVTSRYEENRVLERCAKLGVKLIPKNLVPILPIRIQAPLSPQPNEHVF